MNINPDSALNDVQNLIAACKAGLEDAKALDITEIDVSGGSSIADCMIICTGTSGRHVCAIADRLTDYLAARGMHGISVCGSGVGEWVIIDAGAVMIHVLQPLARERYQLEDLYKCMRSAGENE